MMARKLVTIIIGVWFAAGVPMAAYSSDAHSGNDHGKKMTHEGGESDYSLIQVMDDLTFQVLRIQTGILKGNRLMIKHGAKSIADHPKPKGGLKPYLKKNVETLKQMAPEMDKRVHRTAKKMVETAETESIQGLQEKLNTIVSGCIQCHKMFRDE